MVDQGSAYHIIKVAIALLCYNNRKLLEQFLPEVIETASAVPGSRVFVIDNASTDDTQEYLGRFSDRIEVIRIHENRGFTNGYKEGLSQIDAEIVCLLSSDVEVSPGWIQPVVDLFDSDPGIAVVQPKIKSWHHKDQFEYAGASGGFIDSLAYPFCRGRLFYTIEKDVGQYEDPMEIFWASGACFFIRSEVYHASGGLDNDFYAHMEEIDLCWRLKNMGYRIMACPASEVFHIGGAVIAYGSPEKTYRNHRNNLIMMVKNLPPDEVFGKILLRMLLDALAFGNMIARGQLKASFSILLAHWSFLLHLGRWLSKRRTIKASVQAYSKTGIYPRWVIADYFLKGKRTFSQLRWKP